jgi:hypothetical protein
LNGLKSLIIPLADLRGPGSFHLRGVFVRADKSVSDGKNLSVLVNRLIYVE